LFIAGCPTTLPIYINGAISTGGGQDTYMHGHVLTYMCDTNFASATNPIECTCDTMTDPSNPVWICALALATTCLRSKHFISATQVLNSY